MPTGGVPTASPQDAAPDEGRTPDPGAMWDSDASLAPHAEEVVRYTMRASLDPAAHTIHGEGTLVWRNTSSQPVSEIWLHLYLNAFKNQRSAFLREPAAGGRGSGKVVDWGYIDVHRLSLRETGSGVPKDLWPTAETHRPNDDDETDARVPLPQPVAPGATITLDMTWDDKLPAVIERTGYDGSFHFAGQWFPKIARLEPDGRWAHFPFHRFAEFYSDFGTYDVTLDVPEAFTLGATGPVVESKIEGGRRRERHVQGDVHDFAWTAYDHWQSATETIAGVAVTILYPPGYRVDAGRELGSMRFAIPHFAAKYGRYPYPTLTLVHPPDTAREAGGMEYPTLITTGGPWYGPPGVMAVELVTIHEFGHQYFYGLLASDEAKWPFLDEGLNSYAEEESLAAWLGAGSAFELAGLTLSDANVQATLGNSVAHNERVAQPANAFQSGSDYGSLVYARTATIVETMRRVYGDGPVSRAMGRYARRSRFLHPTPDDLLKSFSEVLGPKAAETMRAALFDKAWVDYAISGIFSHPTQEAAGIYDRNGKRETVPAGTERGSHEGWVLVTRRGTLSFPVDVEVTLSDGSVERMHWDGEGESIRLPYNGAFALTSARVDPDHAILLDEKVLNNFASTDAAPNAGAPRTFERVMYWAELLLQALLP